MPTTTETTNVEQLTFGVELETTIPVGMCNVGSYSTGSQVDFLPPGWKAKYDCSIQAGRDRVGCEFVSPPLCGAAGLRQVVEVVKILNERGAKVNTSTGCHVHVGWNFSDKALDRLVTLTANFERAIYAATGTKSREDGRWCGGVHRHQNLVTAKRQTEMQRYHLLNLTNLRNPRKPNTVEFRAFSGSLNEAKVIGWIAMCLGLVERSVKAKKIASWTAKPTSATSPIKRGGDGQTTLCRLFYQLGWIKGRQSHTFGYPVEDVRMVPSLKAIKKQLMRLAKKYDAAE